MAQTTNTAEKINIAILSCNHGHAKGYYNLKDHPNYNLVGVSVEPGYRDKVFLERLKGIPTYDSDEELFSNHPEIQAVVIGSANIKHFEQFKYCAERKLHILSMKVPTFNMQEY